MGCHICWLNYFTLVCLWCGRTVGRAVCGHVITKFSGMGSLPHFFYPWCSAERFARESSAMNVHYSSHKGGVWESQIRTTRSILNCVLNDYKGRLDTSSLRTFLYEVMAIINSRPLTYQCLNDPKSLEPLTPNHLLTMKNKTLLPPPGNFVKEEIYARKRWRKVQFLAEQFWSRWRKEYCTVPQVIANRKWSRDRKWFPKWTANDPRPQVIPKVDCKWSRKKNRNGLDSS